MDRSAAGNLTNLASSTLKVIGVDLEWTVELGEGGKPVGGGGWKRTGTIQVAVLDEVVIIHVSGGLLISLS